MAVVEVPIGAEHRADARTRTRRVSTLVAAFLALLMLASIGIVSPVAAKGGGAPAERVIAAVRTHLGARYVWGSTGPNSFDCSGLVYRAFRQARLAKRIGGFNTAHGYFYSFRKQGKTGRTSGQPGDLVVYNGGGHIGIYIGGGKVISALISGVKVHKIQGLNIKFTTFVHLGLDSDSTWVANKSTSKATYRRAERRLPLRAGPGRGADALRSVSKGKRLKVLATRDRGSRGVWVKVQLKNGDKGWARKTLTRAI